MPDNRDYQEIDIDLLVPFANHPFSQYEGQRLADMAESIRVNGVLSPLVVRSAADGKYEILSGHNRVAAAKEAGLRVVPALVREGLTDEDALLIVTETNLIQRSFSDLRHSERAVALATHYDAIKKKPGYRSDLLEEIEALTRSPVANRKRSMDRLGEGYGLSKDTIARYLRVNALIATLKTRLDNNGMAMRVAVSLSYLKDEEQEAVEGFLAAGRKISIKQAKLLREEAREGGLDDSSIERILEPEFRPGKSRAVKLGGKFLSRYFDEGQSAEEIEGVIAEALERYFSDGDGWASGEDDWESE